MKSMAMVNQISIKNHLKQLKNDGYVKLNKFGLKQSDAEELSHIGKELFKKFRKKKLDNKVSNYYSPPSEGSEVIFRLPEQNKRAFEIINKVLKNENFKSTFENILGKNFKLRDCSIRRSLPGDNGLYLHQDAVGETNLCILLSNNPKGFGSTCFLPGSHLINTRMKKWGIEAPIFLVRLIKFVFKNSPGLIGDCYIFFNRTWHGRTSNYTRSEYDVILMSFFPSNIEIPDYSWSNEFVKSIKNTEFAKLINFQSNKIINPDYNKTYVTSIEKSRHQISKKNFLNLFFTIYFLRVFFALFRPLYRFFKYKVM